MNLNVEIVDAVFLLALLKIFRISRYASLTVLCKSRMVLTYLADTLAVG